MAQEKIKILKRYSRPLKSVLRANPEADDSAEVLSLLIEYNDKNAPLREQKFDDFGEPEEHHRFEYDDRGNLLLHLFEMPREGIVERFVTTRNADGLPLEIVKFYGDDAGEKVNYEYGAHTLPVTVVRFDADGVFESTETLEYDEQRRLLSRTIREANGELKKFVFSYNEQGWLVAEEEFDTKQQTVGKVEYGYDEEGREVAVNKHNEAGKIISTVRSSYDANGRLVQRVSKGFYTRISTFEYDESGRLLEEALSDEHGFVISRHRMEYSENGLLSEETVYETDLTRAGRDTHLAHRYDYEFFAG